MILAELQVYHLQLSVPIEDVILISNLL